MAIQSTRGTDAWIERISVQEMPALCATVWMLEKMAKDDNMSLADLGNSFAVVNEIQWVPFNMRTVLQLAVITLLPVGPLLLTMVPLEELLERLFKLVF